MRLARLAALAVALTLLGAPVAGAATWTPAATLATCAPASDPVVAFPFSEPSTRSGRGAIMWIGGAPSCAGTGAGRPVAVTPARRRRSTRRRSIPTISRAFPRAVVRRRALVGPLESATTTAGQLVAVAGDPADAVGGRPGALLGEGLAGGVLPVVVPLGGPDSPVATADGYIGDADVVSTATSLGGDQLIELREQRHYARSFAPAITLEEGFAPITALTVGMDFRGDSIVLWAQGGEVHAQWVTNDGNVYAAQLLGPAGYAPVLAAVLSDNDHAFVMWTDEPAPGRPGEARIFLEHSGNNVALPVAPQLLAEFAEPAAQRLGPGSIALVRVTPSEGVLAAWTLIAGGNYEVQAAGLTSSQVLPAATIAEPGVDLRLAALATGPRERLRRRARERAALGRAASTRASRRSSPRAASPAAPAGSPSRRRRSSRRPASTAPHRSRSTPTATARWWSGRPWSAGVPAVAYAVRTGA